MSKSRCPLRFIRSVDQPGLHRRISQHVSYGDVEPDRGLRPPGCFLVVEDNCDVSLEPQEPGPLTVVRNGHPDEKDKNREAFVNYDETHHRFVIFHAMKMRTLFYELLD